MDIKLLRIADRGNENERLVMRALNNCNLRRYIVLDTTYDEAGIVSNKLRHVYVMPNINVSVGDYIVLYTCAGEDNSHANKAKTTTHNLYWGLDITVWNQDGDKAYLIHSDDCESMASQE